MHFASPPDEKCGLAQCANQTVTFRESHFGYLWGGSDIPIRMRRLMRIF